MRHLIAAALFAPLALTTPAALAQDSTETEPRDDLREGVDLLGQGMGLLMQGLMGELEPSLRELEGALGEMKPALRELERVLGDLSAYHPPEVLPNGDIIIRRKVPLDPADPTPDTPEVGEGGEVEL